MIYEDFVTELAAAGLSGREFARLLRLNVNTVAGYKARGTVPSHLAVIARLMRVLHAQRIPFREHVEALDIQAKAPRGIPIPTRDLQPTAGAKKATGAAQVGMADIASSLKK